MYVLAGVEEEDQDRDGGVEFLDRGLHGFEFGGVTPVENEVEAVGGKLLGGSQADSIAGAGDTGPWLNAVAVVVESGGPEEGQEEDGSCI